MLEKASCSQRSACYFSLLYIRRSY